MQKEQSVPAAAFGGPLPRRRLFSHAMRLASAMALPLLFTEGCGPRMVPSQRLPEPPLVHYRMPYEDQALTQGPGLERAYDEAALLSALQGIVNRTAPRLYLLGMPSSVWGLPGPSVADMDAFWWERMAALGWEVARQTAHVAASLSELLEIFGHRTHGLVVWDPKVPATANVAATLAGVLDLLPVAYRPAPAGPTQEWQLIGGGGPSLYAELIAKGWKAAVQLVHPDGSSLFTGQGTVPGTELSSSGSAKNDAYLWAKAHYLDRGLCSADSMGYFVDAYWLQNPGPGGNFWGNLLANHDYFVARRAFFFDLDPWSDEAPVDDPHAQPGTDAATLTAILASANRLTRGKHMVNIGGFPPWQFKYSNSPSAGSQHDPVATEWRYAEIVSAYNAFMEADTYMANGSFTQHFPLKQHYPQPGPPDAAALRTRGLIQADGSVTPGRYFAFYVGDWDSPSWLWHLMPTFWNDPDRGSVPLSWAFDPNLSLRGGPAMVWTRETATANDSFVAGDSGAGYLNPGGLQTPRSSGLPSGVALWAAHCARFYQQWDIRVTGFIIEGNAPSMGPSGMKAYSSFSPGGIVGQKLPAEEVVDGMPVMAMATDLPRDATQAADTVRHNMFLPLTDLAQFKVARAVWLPPSWYRDVVQKIQATDASEGPIHILDLPTLLALMAQDQAHGGGLGA